MVTLRISVLACLAAVAVTAAPDLSGQGHLIVLNGTGGLTNQTLADRVGCVSTEGFLTVDDCGVFSDLTTSPTTSAGPCNFQNPDQPINSDSIYGQQDHAYQCYSGASAAPFYSIDGFPQAYVCQGDLDCLWDVNRAPAAGEKLPIWPYRWGSQQLGITPGHLEALLLWQKIQ